MRGRIPDHGSESPRMKRLQLACVAFLVCLTTLPASAQRYAARREGDIVQLTDTATDTRVSVAPGIGNIAYRMTVKGHDVLRWPHADMAAFKANPNQTGIPFMAPSIDRLDEQAFYANGKRYAFDMGLGNIRGAIPIHGLVTTTSEWHVVSVDAGRMGAAVTSRLEFSRQPSWMKQWPFAHTIEMTYRLTNGTLEVDRRSRTSAPSRCRSRLDSVNLSSPTRRATSGRSPSARVRT